VIFSHHQSMCCICSFYFEAYCWKSLLEIIKRIKFSLYFESKFEIPKFIQITSLVVIFFKSIIDFKLSYKRQRNLFEIFFSSQRIDNPTQTFTSFPNSSINLTREQKEEKRIKQACNV